MFDDPKALSAADWQNIQILLQWHWIYLPLIAIGAVTLVIAHAFIPSLVITGHLDESALRARPVMTVFAVLVLAAAAVILALAINQTLTQGNFWDRWLI